MFLGMCMYAKSLQSCPTLCDPMDCSPPGSSSMGFSKQEYCSGFPCPSPGDLPDPRVEPACPVSPALQMDYLSLSRWGTHTYLYVKPIEAGPGNIIS